MPNKVLKIFLAALLPILCISQTQTGYVDLNKQLGDLEAINENTNTICYTQIFQREFKNVPKIATTLAEFKTEDTNDFHLFIKIRKIELSKSGVKFLIFSRKDISIWTKVVFSYLVTDHPQVFPDVVHLETDSLAGCGKILEQQFLVALPKKMQSPHLTAFINGFDVTGKQIGSELVTFQMSIQIKVKNQDTLSLFISRQSPIQIYSVSIGYIAVNTMTETNNLQVIQKVQFLNNIPNEEPYIFVQEHHLNLRNANIFIGFQSFYFQYESKQKNQINSLALTINQQYLVLGSLDSYTLKEVQIAYLIVQQLLQCKDTEVVYYDSIDKQKKCRQCDILSHRIPSENQDSCVCMPNYFQIKDQCYEEPDQGIFDAQERMFVCKDGYSMVYKKSEKAYSCQKPPKNKLYDSKAQVWVCIDSYYEKDGICYTIPKDAYFDETTKSLICKGTKYLIDGSCIQSGQNEEYSFAFKKFVCKSGYFRVQNSCIKPIKNAFYNDKTGQFECFQQFYQSQPGKCDQIPLFMKYDQKLKKLICMDEYYYIKDQGCQKIPQGMRYLSSLQKFICESGSYYINGYCRKPQQNQKWSNQLKQLVCIEGSYRISGDCLKPSKNYRYSKITKNFECKEGFYEIKNQCLQPPKNGEYSIELKSFVCLQGFENIKNQCIFIPTNKIWSTQFGKFICEQGYYELKDQSCMQPQYYQIYDKSSKLFICDNDSGYYHIKGKCKNLPKYAKYSKESQDFFCIQKYYKSHEKCELCNNNCLQCTTVSDCTSCVEGYKPQLGSCIQYCGDGIKIDADCDDGNQVDGDGCSANCQIQIGYSCSGSPDECVEIKLEQNQMAPYPIKPIELKLVGMSHFFGKLALNVKMSYLPANLLTNQSKLRKIFRVLTNSKIPLSISTMYIETTEYTFVVLYDFKKYEPIPEYLTRIQIASQIKKQFFKDIEVRPLFIRINPALMARRDSGADQQIV